MANRAVTRWVTQRLISCADLLIDVSILDADEFEYEIGAQPGDLERMRNNQMRAHNGHVTRAFKRLSINPEYLYGWDKENPFTKLLKRPFLYKKEATAA
jgi:hypothetical protein